MIVKNKNCTTSVHITRKKSAIRDQTQRRIHIFIDVFLGNFVSERETMVHEYLFCCENKNLRSNSEFIVNRCQFAFRVHSFFYETITRKSYVGRGTNSR